MIKLTEYDFGDIYKRILILLDEGKQKTFHYREKNLLKRTLLAVL